MFCLINIFRMYILRYKASVYLPGRRRGLVPVMRAVVQWRRGRRLLRPRLHHSTHHWIHG